jgi:hypothetical protein
MESKSNPPYAVTVVRAASWGQLVGFLTQAAFLAYEDAPDIFARVSPLAVLIPLLAIAALYFLRLDRFVAKNLSPATLAVFVLGTSAATTLLAVLHVLQAYRVPQFLVTAGWEYTRITSVVVLAVFAAALAVNVYVIARARGSDTPRITAQARRNTQRGKIRR